MERSEGSYPSNLSHHEWEAIKSLLPRQKTGGRRRSTDVRRVVDAVLYVCSSGCAWRYLPKDFPAWQTVYDYFSKWVVLGVWQKIHLVLARLVRKQVGREEFPWIAVIDGQSVRASQGEERGWDGYKKVRGRKRQILVDTLGIIWAVKVHRANQVEGTRAHEVLMNYPKGASRPGKILGDFAYGKNPFAYWVEKHWRVTLECKKGTQETYKNEQGKERKRVGISNLRPTRWIVERTFAWFNNQRRLSRDYERKTINSEAFLYIAQLKILLKRAFQ